MKRPETAILHYTAPPVVGGVEAVIQAHVQALIEAGYPVTVVAGRGEQIALTPGANFVRIPKIDSQHRQVRQASAVLEQGQSPSNFDDMVNQLMGILTPILGRFDNVIVHNVLTKHFNLPLTAALHYLLGRRRHSPLPRLVPRFHLGQPPFSVQGSPRLPLGSLAYTSPRRELRRRV